MYSSKIKEIWEKIHLSYKIDNSFINSTKNEKNSLNISNIKDDKNIFTEEDYNTISDFLINKFPETNKIFQKFYKEDYFIFIYLSKFYSYEEGKLIFSKDEESNLYAFILFGDINLYTDSTNINSTLSAGEIYGHLVKDKHKFDLKAKNNASLVLISKSVFDQFIISLNNKRKTFKLFFIKKYFPKLRNFTDDVINNILTYFERVKFTKYDRVLTKEKYNEYIYLIISGEVGYCLKPKSIVGEIDADTVKESDYIIMEKLKKGDIIGINSALNGIKNIYNCIALTDEVQFYRISKGDFLYYLGGKYSDSSLNLKSIGDLQDMAIQKKIEYLKNVKEQNVLINFCIKLTEKEKESILYNKGCFIIYEDPIENILFEKLKSAKSGMLEFKELLGQKKRRRNEINKINFDINNNDTNFGIGVIKKEKNYSIYRVTSGRLNLKLNNNQMKSLNKLNGLCGVKSNKDSDESKTNHKILTVNSKSILDLEEDEKMK